MKGELHVLNHRGHTPVAWDTEVDNGPLDPAYAKAEFDRLVAQGHMAFGTSELGENKQIRRFDPEGFPRITLTPAFAGG